MPYVGKVVSISKENALTYRLILLVKSDKPDNDLVGVIAALEALHIGDMTLEYIAKSDKK